MPLSEMQNKSTPSSSSSGDRIIPGLRIFYNKKNFSLRGRAMQKISPISTIQNGKKPKNDVVDLSLLDMMGFEEFLVMLKNRTENNNLALWRVSCALAGQLKGSRELLSLGSYLSSNNNNVTKVFDRLIDTAYFLLNAEHVYLLQMDHEQMDHFVITHSRSAAVIGTKINISSVYDGIASKILNISNLNPSPDGGGGGGGDTKGGFPSYLALLDEKTGSQTVSLISSPIFVDGMVAG